MYTIKTDSCDQHFNVTAEGVQHHCIWLKDVNGIPYCFFGFIIKDNKKHSNVIMCRGLATIICD